MTAVMHEYCTRARLKKKKKDRGPQTQREGRGEASLDES